MPPPYGYFVIARHGGRRGAVQFDLGRGHSRMTRCVRLYSMSWTVEDAGPYRSVKIVRHGGGQIIVFNRTLVGERLGAPVSSALSLLSREEQAPPLPSVKIVRHGGRWAFDLIHSR